MASHNLGELWKLPPEIRLQIWKELRPCGDILAAPTKGKIPGNFGILRACRQLNEEITPYLYQNEVLHFRVGCTLSESLTIDNTNGAHWTIANTRDPLYATFSNLPFKKLNRIRISIDALESGNLAQLYCLSKHVRHLIGLLEQADGLAPLEIELLESPSGHWSLEDGKPRMSVPETFEPDYRVALLPFCRLQNVPKITIRVPESLEKERAVLNNLEKFMKRDEHFGSVVVGDEEYWDDKNLQESLDYIYMLLEEELDTIPGEAANMLRLERFMSWYSDDGRSEYLNEWKRIADAREFLYSSTLTRRHDFLLAFNPQSAKMQKMRLQLGLPGYLRSFKHVLAGGQFNHVRCMWYLKEVENFEDHHDLGDKDELAGTELRSCWSRKAWQEYYPDGIPPLNGGPGALLNFVVAMGEYECEKGLSYAEWPQGFDRMQQQALTLDFNRGEKIRLALEKWDKDGFLKYRDIDVDVLEGFGF